MLLFVKCSKNNDDIKANTNTELNSHDNSLFNNTIDAQISFYWKEYLNNNENNEERNIFHKIWHWLVAHAGVWMFGDCGLELPCGPCPGLCASVLSSGNAFTPVEDNYQIPENDYNNGDRLIQLALLNDSIMEINIINSDLVYNDTLFILNDFNIGIDASAAFEKDSIIVKKGNYPISYTYGANGNTLLNVVTY